MGDVTRPPAEPVNDSSPLDRFLDGMCHPWRRHVLYLLWENDAMDIEAVARRVAAREVGRDPADLEDDVYRPVLVTLYHKHIPRLNETGIVEYDRRSGAIRFQHQSDEFEALLEVVREVDDLSVERVSEEGG